MTGRDPHTGHDCADPAALELIASIEMSPIASIVTDCRVPDNPVVGVNKAFEELTGYSRDEVLGRNCRLLAGPLTEAEPRSELRSAVAAGRPAMVELTNYRRDGTAFRNAVMIAPVRAADGAVAWFVGSQMNVDLNDDSVRKAEARRRAAKLTPRMRQVLLLMTQGLRNKQIAAELGIEEQTVKMHRARMLAALSVATTAEAIRIAVEAGLDS